MLSRIETHVPAGDAESELVRWAHPPRATPVHHGTVNVGETVEEKRIKTLLEEQTAEGASQLQRGWGALLVDCALFVGRSFMYLVEGTGHAFATNTSLQAISPAPAYTRPRSGR